MSTIFDEFCRETTAFINPTDCIKPLSEFPEICITTFSQNIITEFIENNNTKIIANLYSANGILPVYEIKYDDAVVNGFLALFLNLIVLPLLVVVSFMLFKGSIIMFFLLLLFLALAVLMIPGYFSQEPNEARVMVFFGKYKGTFTETGFFWVNPFMNKKKLSLRARNLDVEPIKVNDKIGNPILIGLVLVWKLKDTYKAMFEIDAQTMADNRGSGQMTVTVAGRMNAFEDFVRVQSDAALRQVAGLYAYDDNEADLDELTLRSGGDEINEQLEQKLNVWPWQVWR